MKPRTQVALIAIATLIAFFIAGWMAPIQNLPEDCWDITECNQWDLTNTGE